MQGRRRASRKTLDRLTDALARREAADALVPLRQVFEIQPVPKPRMTAADRWKKRPCVLRYRAYCDELRLRGARIPSRYRLTFVMPMPASWPESWRVRMDGKPHLPRPDASNLAKAVEDALEPKDETLHCTAADKIWGRRALLIIEKT